MFELTPDEKREWLRRMYLDIFFFAKVLFGDANHPMHYHVRQPSPPFHKTISDELMTMSAGDKLAVVAPRGHAKSSFINLIYPLHRILFGEEFFVLMISESEEQSKFNLEALGDEIEMNPKIKYFFGDRKGVTWGKESKEVITGFHSDGTPSGTCKLLVRGVGQKVRGLKYGPYRPTLTIIDDGEGEANSATQAQREKFRRWLNAAVIPGSDDSKLVFIGTIVDDEAYLNRIAGPKAYDKKTGAYKQKAWRSLFFQSIPQDVENSQFIASGSEYLDSDGVPEVLWPERRPYSWLDAEHQRLKDEGDEGFFFQEYQNIPMDDAIRVFKAKDLQYWEGGFRIINKQPVLVGGTESGEKKFIPVNIFMGVDPASSDNEKADYTVIMVIGVDKDYNIYVIEYHRAQMLPMDGADRLVEMANKYKPKSINIEKTGHAMLSDYIFRVSKETGKFWNINPKDAIKSKYYRIKQMQPMFASHAVFLKEEHAELEAELLAFKEHGTGFKKDTLDALRWATDDIWAPTGEFNAEDETYHYDIPAVGQDWETGQVIY